MASAFTTLQEIRFWAVEQAVAIRIGSRENNVRKVMEDARVLEAYLLDKPGAEIVPLKLVAPQEESHEPA